MIIIDEDQQFARMLIDGLNTFLDLECIWYAPNQVTPQQLAFSGKADLILINSTLEDWQNIKSQLGLFSFYFYNKNEFVSDTGRIYPYSVLRQFIIAITTNRAKISKEQSLVQNYWYGLFPLLSKNRLKLFRMTDIVFFHSCSSLFGRKVNWYMRLHDGEEVKLGKTSTAKEILKFLDDRYFVRINRSAIVNLNCLERVDYKLNKCIFLSSVNASDILLSRPFLADFKKRFDRF